MITDHMATGILQKVVSVAPCRDFIRHHMVHMLSHDNHNMTPTEANFCSRKAVAI